MVPRLGDRGCIILTTPRRFLAIAGLGNKSSGLFLDCGWILICPEAGRPFVSPSTKFTVSAPGYFRGSMADLCTSLPTLRQRPRERLRTTQGRCGSVGQDRGADRASNTTTAECTAITRSATSHTLPHIRCPARLRARPARIAHARLQVAHTGRNLRLSTFAPSRDDEQVGLLSAG
jgi:hypothetical protein